MHDAGMQVLGGKYRQALVVRNTESVESVAGKALRSFQAWYNAYHIVPLTGSSTEYSPQQHVVMVSAKPLACNSLADLTPTALGLVDGQPAGEDGEGP